MYGWLGFAVASGAPFEIGLPPQIDEDFHAVAAECERGSASACEEASEIAFRHGNTPLADLAAAAACELGRFDLCFPGRACELGHVPACRWTEGVYAHPGGLMQRCEEGSSEACRHLEANGLRGGEIIRTLDLPTERHVRPADLLVGPDAETVLGKLDGGWWFARDGERLRELALPPRTIPVLEVGRWTEDELWFPLQVHQQNRDMHLVGFWRDGKVIDLPREWREVPLPERARCPALRRTGTLVTWHCTWRVDGEEGALLLRATLDGRALPTVTAVPRETLAVPVHDEGSGRTLLSWGSGDDRVFAVAVPEDGELREVIEDPEVRSDVRVPLENGVWAEIDLDRARLRRVTPGWGEPKRLGPNARFWLDEGPEVRRIRLVRAGKPGPSWVTAAAIFAWRTTGDDRGFVYGTGTGRVLVYAEPPSSQLASVTFPAARLRRPALDLAHPPLEERLFREPRQERAEGDTFVTGRALDPDGWPSLRGDGVDGRFRKQGWRAGQPVAAFGRQVEVPPGEEVDIGDVVVEGPDFAGVASEGGLAPPEQSEPPARPRTRRMTEIPGLSQAIEACSDGEQTACEAVVARGPDLPHREFRDRLRNYVCRWFPASDPRCRPEPRIRTSSPIAPLGEVPEGLELKRHVHVGDFQPPGDLQPPEIEGITVDDAGVHVWGSLAFHDFVMHFDPASDAPPTFQPVPPSAASERTEHGFASVHQLFDERFVSVGDAVLPLERTDRKALVRFSPRGEVLVDDEEGIIRWDPRGDRVRYVPAPSGRARAVSPDGRLAASMAPTGELRVVKLRNGKVIHRQRIGEPLEEVALAFTSDRHLLVCAGHERHFGRVSQELTPREGRCPFDLEVGIDGSTAWVGQGFEVEAYDGATLEPLGLKLRAPDQQVAAHEGWLVVASNWEIWVFATGETTPLDTRPVGLGGTPALVGAPRVTSPVRSLALQLDGPEQAGEVRLLVDGAPHELEPHGDVLYAELPADAEAKLVSTNPGLGLGGWGRGITVLRRVYGSRSLQGGDVAPLSLLLVTEDGSPAKDVRVEIGRETFAAPDGSLDAGPWTTAGVRVEAWDAEGRSVEAQVTPNGEPQTLTLEPGRRIRIRGRRADGTEAPLQLDTRHRGVRIVSDGEGWAWVPRDAELETDGDVLLMRTGTLRVRSSLVAVVTRLDGGDAHPDHRRAVLGLKTTVPAGRYRVLAQDPRGALLGAEVTVNAQDTVDVVLKPIAARPVTFVLRDRADWPEVGFRLGHPDSDMEPHAALTDLAGRVTLLLPPGSHQVAVPPPGPPFQFEVPAGAGPLEIVVPPERMD